MAAAPQTGKGEAAYRVLAEELRQGILRKTFPEGRLPTEAELAKAHGLSRQTVRRAFQELVSGGMVYRVPGRGTFVANHAGQYIRQFGSVEDLMALSLDGGLPPAARGRPVLHHHCPPASARGPADGGRARGDPADDEDTGHGDRVARHPARGADRRGRAEHHGLAGVGDGRGAARLPGP